MEDTRLSIRNRKKRERRLRAQLPDSTTSKEYENALHALRREHREWQAQRAAHLQSLRTLLADRKDAITAKSNELVETFAALIQELLVEEVRLVRMSVEPRTRKRRGRLRIVFRFRRTRPR